MTDDITDDELDQIEVDRCTCLRCGGEGSYWPMYNADEIGMVACGMCGGTGRIKNTTSRLLAALRRRAATIATLTKERDEAKRCTNCNGSGRMTIVTGWESVNGESMERTDEDECAQCEGKGQDR